MTSRKLLNTVRYIETNLPSLAPTGKTIYPINASSADINVELPTGSNNEEILMYAYNAANTITIKATSTATIQSSSSTQVQLTRTGDALNLLWDGSTWQPCNLGSVVIN